MLVDNECACVYAEMNRHWYKALWVSKVYAFVLAGVGSRGAGGRAATCTGSSSDLDTSVCDKVVGCFSISLSGVDVHFRRR
jgi:hypothetical protein